MNMNLKNNWNDLNWRKIYAFVSKLQSELVAAYSNKDWIGRKLISYRNNLLCLLKLAI